MTKLATPGAPVIVLFALVLAGCSAPCAENLQMETIQEIYTAKVDRSLLTHSPCAPPCWQGITPGVTALNDATPILAKLPFIEPTSISLQSGADGSQTLFWDSALSHRNVQIGAIRSDSQLMVSSISIRQIEYALTLRDLLAVYGEPSGYTIAVSQVDAPACDTLSIVWLRYGLIIKYPSVHSGGKLAGDETPISGVSYFPPVSGSLHNGQTVEGQVYQVWKGVDAVSAP